MDTKLLLVVAALSAAVGAASAHLLGPASAPSEPAAGADAPALEPDPRPGVELDAVEAATLDLDRRLGALELAQHAASRMAAGPEDVPVDAAQLAALEERLGALEAQLAKAGGSPPRALSVGEEMKLQVAEALEQVRKDETVAKVESRQEKEVEALEGRLDKYRAELGLSEGQVSDLRGMFEERQRREREIVRLWQDGADDETLSAEKQSLTEDMTNQLGEVLSAEQLEGFYSLQRSGRGK